MAEDLLQQVRWLKRYSVLSTVVFLTLAILAFRNQPRFRTSGAVRESSTRRKRRSEHGSSRPL
jgi:hypothetical protein